MIWLARRGWGRNALCRRRLLAMSDATFDGESSVTFHDGLSLALTPSRSGVWVRLCVPAPGLEPDICFESDPGPGAALEGLGLRLSLVRAGFIRPHVSIRSDRGAVEVEWSSPRVPGPSELASLLQRARSIRSAVPPEEALIRGLIDPDPQVRLWSAVGCGALGRTELERLALDDRLLDRVRIAAARTLLLRATIPEERLRLLSGALRSKSEPLIELAIDAAPRTEGGVELIVRSVQRGTLAGVAAVRAIYRLTADPDGVEALESAAPNLKPGLRRVVGKALAARKGLAGALSTVAVSRGGLSPSDEEVS